MDPVEFIFFFLKKSRFAFGALLIQIESYLNEFDTKMFSHLVHNEPFNGRGF